MKLDGRRESTNVDDRRGRGGMVRTAGGLGIGGVIIVGLITLLMGGDLGDVVNNVQSMGGVGGAVEQTQVDQTQFTAEEQELARFSRQILAGTEDVWTKIFAEQGWGEYQAPTLVLFSGAVQSGCGGATSSSGPFYCSADHCVYLDLSFFSSMKKQLGADGDFAYAYVIAHEVGHHVQYLLGILGDAHKKMAQASQTESNKISVRLELQADFFAGIWGYYDNALFGSLEMGDVEEGLNVASKIGDDYLQKKARGYSVPDSFNHGTSAQRSKWLKKGLTTGNVQLGDTFSPAYNTL
ncbi:MAG: neutral zinc metallopeptidase [Bacteroidales bacterium]|nr:neutral zinc metallopeptidase [Bacteroidales bacterium]